MHSDPGRPSLRFVGAIAGALVPWITFLVILAADGKNTAGVAAAGLPFISLPSLVPVASAKPGPWRAIVVIGLAATAAYAANFINTSESSTAALAIFTIPFAAVVLTVVTWVSQGLARSRKTEDDPDDPPVRVGDHIAARPNARFAAWFIDAALLFGSLVVPLTKLSHNGQETAAFVIGAVIAVTYFALPVTLWGATIGHRLLNVRVIDIETGEPPSLVRALLRACVVATESALVLTVYLGLVALFDFWVTSTTGRSVPDMLLRTAVVRAR